MPGLVTVLTDFGTRDGYVAAMKGVLLARAPELAVVDLAHDLAPGDVAAAAYVLLQSAPHFPADTVHLVVVDPGVGTERRAVAGRIDEQLYVAPDNGVLSRVLDAGSPGAFHGIAHPVFAAPQVSAVFHGRDVFAPVAAFLALGGSLAALGDSIELETLVRLSGEPPRRDGTEWTGAIIHVDRFGNLISNIPVEAERAGAATAVLGSREISVGRTYGDAEPGALIALRGSSGLLEIACNGASAAELTGAARGDVIRLRALQRS